MNKADLTEALAERADIPKVHAARYINILTMVIREALTQGEKVTISDFGTFTVSQRKAFTGHNPKNSQEIVVPARRIPVFRAGKGLKNALNPDEE
ncbi:MAG: HU family DNA-binding protein [Alphaproteobacteria bacterium]|nr:HU family DNA-binding protein [Alphaproteobacteria bacterium]